MFVHVFAETNVVHSCLFTYLLKHMLFVHICSCVCQNKCCLFMFIHVFAETNTVCSCLFMLLNTWTNASSQCSFTYIRLLYSYRIFPHFCSQRVIDCNLMGLIVENLSRNNLRIQLVCCWCVCNLLTGGTSDQIR